MSYEMSNIIPISVGNIKERKQPNLLTYKNNNNNNNTNKKQQTNAKKINGRRIEK